MASLSSDELAEVDGTREWRPARFICPHHPMSLTGVSLGRLLAGRASLRFPRRHQYHATACAMQANSVPGNDSNRARSFNPLLRGQGEAVQAGVNFNPVEFDGIKTRIIETFPDAEEFDRIAVSEPIACSF